MSFCDILEHTVFFVQTDDIGCPCRLYHGSEGQIIPHCIPHYPEATINRGLPGGLVRDEG